MPCAPVSRVLFTLDLYKTHLLLATFGLFDSDNYPSDLYNQFQISHPYYIGGGQNIGNRFLSSEVVLQILTIP